MSYHEDLFYGIADELADVDAVLNLGVLPQDAKNAIAINFYSVQDHGTMTDSIQGVQLAIRAQGRDPRLTPALSEAVFDRLHGITGADWHGIPIVHCYRNSSAYLGTDDSGNHKITDNYYVQLSRAGRHRTDT
ncbi:phage tail terminator protein [Brevibacterium oceani]|uniref:phage tail terminator protein n=1 Tax=Brevibacterium oceani TaxID=358099 RepID=UPI0015E6933A|nr:minor capsid protein [Brevibacterium oceani]